MPDERAGSGPDEAPVEQAGARESRERHVDSATESSTADPGHDLARAALARARASARAAALGHADRTPGRVRPQAPDPGGSGGRRSAGPGVRTGSGPDDRDPQRLQSTIARLLAERGWETETAVASVLSRWDDLVGPELAAHCRPDTLDDGVLTVITRSSAWATQVRLLAPQLIHRLNERLGHGTVLRVRVRGPEAPSWQRGGRSVRGRGPRDTYG